MKNVPTKLPNSTQFNKPTSIPQNQQKTLLSNPLPTSTQLHNPTGEKLSNFKSEIEKKETDAKQQKPKSIRLKLDDKTLFYSENGMKKYYDVLMKTDFNTNSSSLGKLNKLMQIYKNWHFMLFPKYDIDYFMNMTIDHGKKATGRVFKY
jgi:hypothetical protein